MSSSGGARASLITKKACQLIDERCASLFNSPASFFTQVSSSTNKVAGSAGCSARDVGTTWPCLKNRLAVPGQCSSIGGIACFSCQSLTLTPPPAAAPGMEKLPQPCSRGRLGEEHGPHSLDHSGPGTPGVARTSMNSQDLLVSGLLLASLQIPTETRSAIFINSQVQKEWPLALRVGPRGCQSPQLLPFSESDLAFGGWG